MKKIIASIAAAALTVTAMSVASFAADAKLSVDREKANEDGKGYLITMLNKEDTNDGDNYYVTFAETDVITLKVSAAEGVDTSKWVVSLKGFDQGWGGWNGPASEEGVLEVSGTVKEIMDANSSITTLEDLQGVNAEVAGTNANEAIKFTVTVEAAASTSGGDETPDNTENQPGNTEKPTDDKQNSDTGIEGVAIVAGLAVVAAGAVVVAKKRK